MLAYTFCDTYISTSKEKELRTKHDKKNRKEFFIQKKNNNNFHDYLNTVLLIRIQIACCSIMIKLSFIDQGGLVIVWLTKRELRDDIVHESCTSCRKKCVL